MDAADLAFAGLARQAQLIATGEVSSRELVEASLERISTDPQLNAFRIVFAERARTEADQADARRGAGDRRPLLGVPVAVKDDSTSPGRSPRGDRGAVTRRGGRQRDRAARCARPARS